jgi:peptide-methionine (R)-S-oxide reductase
MTDKIRKSSEEWRQQLTPEQYRVAREKGTERSFTGEYWNHHQEGKYVCVCCGAELFSSKTKFDSGTGWPSFWAPASESDVTTEEDFSHHMHRTEALCSRCDAPEPTGLRYCLNSASLRFIKDQD